MSWSNFDVDRDGAIDMVTFIHSGYAAELTMNADDGIFASRLE
jgi:hypothetical protein